MKLSSIDTASTRNTGGIASRRSSWPTAVRPSADRLVADVGLDLLGDQLGVDVEAAVNIALQGGAVFPGGKDPLLIFRGTLRDSICDIEADKRGRGLLIQRLLRDGPYERDGEIPPALRSKRLTTDETAKAITFIYAFMVNSFKRAVTELLAAGACQRS